MKEESPHQYRVWPPHEIFYIESMLTITRAAMDQTTKLQNILAKLERGHQENSEIVLDIVQQIIVNAASISRYFWPSSTDKIHKRRGFLLRTACNISESNPIKKRCVRNFIEHFDEKLDVYLQKNLAGNIFPSFVGTKTQINQSTDQFFRAFFIEERKFQVLGLTYDVMPIIYELTRIHEFLEKFKENGGRLTR